MHTPKEDLTDQFAIINGLTHAPLFLAPLLSCSLISSSLQQNLALNSNFSRCRLCMKIALTLFETPMKVRKTQEEG